MKFLQQLLSKWLLPFAKIVETNPQLASVRRGMMTLIPITLVGSLPILFWQLPNIPNLPNWFYDFCNFMAGITGPIHFATFGFMALYVAAFVGWYYAKERDVWDIGATVTAMMSFVLVATLAEEGSLKDMSYFGGEGIFTAIVVALLSVEILYIFRHKIKFTINLGDGVPTPIKRSFENLWPILFSVLIISVLNYSIENIIGVPVVELVKTLFAPLTASVNTLPGIIFILFMSQLLWWFGIHGYAVMAPIWIGVAFQNVDANIVLAQSGAAYSEMFIFTPDFMWNLAGLTGSGITGALVILMVFSKSKRYKTIGKVSIVPSFFGIGETVLFGIPTVLNPIMLIPSLISSPLAATIGWYAIKSGLLNPFVMVSPYVPIPLGGFIATMDWRYLIVASIIILANVLLYLPFFRIAEKRAIEDELNAGKTEESLDDLELEF